MSCWLNYQIATPLIGINCGNAFYAPAVLGRASESIFTDIEGQEDNTDIQFRIDNNKEHIFSKASGHEYSLSPSGVRARFRYPIATKQKDTLQFEAVAVEPMEYEDLLAEVIKNVSFAGTHMSTASSQTPIKADRIGVMAFVETKRALLPPGIMAKLLKLDPSSNLIALKHRETVLLNEADGLIDRCHYSFDFDMAKSSENITVTLDWQRVWNERVNLQEVASQIESFVLCAVNHFETLQDD